MKNKFVSYAFIAATLMAVTFTALPKAYAGFEIEVRYGHGYPSSPHSHDHGYRHRHHAHGRWAHGNRWESREYAYRVTPAYEVGGYHTGRHHGHGRGHHYHGCRR